MNAEELKKAREMCDEYDKLPVFPYSKCRKTKRDDYLNQAISALPACLDEIERLQKENAKLKADANKWTDLMDKAGAVGLTEADFFKMVGTVKDVVMGKENDTVPNGILGAKNAILRKNKLQKKLKCPSCGGYEFSTKSLGGGMWRVSCLKCGCCTERFPPVGNKASTREVIEWIESEG